MTFHIRLLLIVAFGFNVLTTIKVVAAPRITNDPLAKTQKSIFEILSNKEVVEITITTDLTNLIENRRTEEYSPATFTHLNEQGETVTRDIELQPRGKFRRRVCDFPPVRLKFAKKDLESEGLNSAFNKIKLVTHCIDDKNIGNDNLLKEYLIYELYGKLTPNTYRAQLVKVTYVDSQGKVSKLKRYGILLEDTDEMAERLGGKEVDIMNTSRDSISAKDEALMAMFQYMIANADWTTEMLRNVKLIMPKGSAKAIPVPYDFDFSGLVNASYAIPQGDKGILTMRDRIYFGAFKEEALLRQTVAHFLQQKETLLQTVKSFKLLNAESREDVANYLQSFYNAIEPAYADTTINMVSFLTMRNATIDAWKQAQLVPPLGSANK
ncbi:MAG: hypothetical protein ACK4TA_03810 [Saprospiraceae bacterium]